MKAMKNTCLIDEMQVELDRGSHSMNKQITTISDIIEKTNNVLLQIEATRSKPISKTPEAAASTYSKETLHSLAKIVELFPNLVVKECRSNQRAQHAEEESNGSHKNESMHDFETFLSTNRKKVEFLGGSVRKLLAINDTVAQMKANLQEH